MNSIWIKLLETAVKALIGSLNYEQIRDVVFDVNSSELLTGEQKRMFVIKQLKDSAIAIGNALLNLAIEVVVVKAKAMK